MRISLFDRSLYYKGLILLIRKDREIHDDEKNMVMSIGKMLGFESKFCALTIEEILENKYIDDSPPCFSETNVALSFIRDGLRLSISDGRIHDAEIAWLESVAETNGLSHLWTEEVEKFYFMNHAEPIENTLELRYFMWD
ncbi:MAG: hypothetical protein JW950_13340 [Deltaproteobacteria bacterium]|nr:hypothetical protein [Deltaproteobacteria bacterium]